MNSHHLHQQPPQASPLQRELTPPPQTAQLSTSQDDLIPFPSVESSVDSSLSNTNTSSFTHSVSGSGSNFHIPSHGLDSSARSYSDSSPTGQRPGTAGSLLSTSLGSGGGGVLGMGGGMDSVYLYCAACQRVSRMSRSFACTECICGLCEACVDALMRERSHGKGVGCPRCREIAAAFKRFAVDVR